MMIRNAQKQKTLKSFGGFFIFSRETFAHIISTAFSIFSLLRNVYGWFFILYFLTFIDYFTCYHIIFIFNLNCCLSWIYTKFIQKTEAAISKFFLFGICLFKAFQLETWANRRRIAMNIWVGQMESKNLIPSRKESVLIVFNLVAIIKIHYHWTNIHNIQLNALIHYYGNLRSFHSYM